MSNDEYIFRQFRLIVVGLGLIAMLIWGNAPLRAHDRKMKKIKHNHEVHHQHFYECKCKI
jgi:hypothetical protein